MEIRLGHWSLQLEFALTALLVVATVLRDLTHRRRRNRAWPDDLDAYLKPYPHPAGIHSLSCIVAGLILTLGVYQIVQPEGSVTLTGLTGAATLNAAAAATFFLAYRAWSLALAELGMALVTVAIARLALGLAGLFTDRAHAVEYADRMPVIFNAVIFALAIMAALWFWMSRFWDQQLLDGVPWTTTGRMIPLARKTGFVVTAMAVLTAFQLAFWPEFVPSERGDGGAGRITASVLAAMLLAWIAAQQARRANSPVMGGLAIAALVAAFAIVLVRATQSPIRAWLLQYDAIALSLACLPILAVAEAAPATRWKSLAAPLWFMALLILPAAGLLTLVGTSRFPADWVRPLTLGILGGVYILAGTREGRRAFLFLGGVIWIAGLIVLFRVYFRA